MFRTKYFINKLISSEFRVSIECEVKYNYLKMQNILLIRTYMSMIFTCISRSRVEHCSE